MLTFIVATATYQPTYYYPVRYPTVPNQNVKCWVYPEQNRNLFVPPPQQQQQWVPKPERQQNRPKNGGANNCALGCACPYNIDPQCGSDGITYSNKCELNCARSNCFPALRISRNGGC